MKKQLINNLRLFSANLAFLGASAVKHVVKDTANLKLASAVGVSGPVADRDDANESDTALPPVVPHQLAAISHSQFCTIVVTHRERLAASGWTLIQLDGIKQDRKDLVRTIAAESALSSATDACKDSISFEVRYSGLKGRLESLWRFVGGIASVFPGKA